MAQFDGKVVLITGAARGMGRQHAVRFAEEGADIVALDICRSLSSVAYALATPDDLSETERQVEAAGRKALCRECDVRDGDRLAAVVHEAIDVFGRLDVVVCNAGVFAWSGPSSKTKEAWTDTVDVNMRGVFNTIEACIPSMVDGGRGGSIVIVNSTAGERPFIDDYKASSPGYVAYVASKHGAVGLMRAYALMLGKHSIRVNSVHPIGAVSPMAENEEVREHMAAISHSLTFSRAMPVDRIDPSDVTNAIIWLASDQAKYVTGTKLPIDAGTLLK